MFMIVASLFIGKGTAFWHLNSAMKIAWNSMNFDFSAIQKTFSDLNLS